MTYYERRLPHWQPEGRSLFVTWRLWGSLPAEAWAKARAEVNRRAKRGAKAGGQECPPHRATPGELFLALDAELEKRQDGPRWLTDGRVARAVVASLGAGASTLNHYRLHAFVVMPNHVHILIEPMIPPVRALKALKGTSARAANVILGRTGKPFWQDESFDHWVRNEAEFDRIRSYIERNPVKAGLARREADWPWSSAGARGQDG